MIFLAFIAVVGIQVGVLALITRARDNARSSRIPVAVDMAYNAREKKLVNRRLLASYMETFNK